MTYGNFLVVLGRFLSRGDLAHGIKDIGRIAAVAARIAVANCDVFKNHKSAFVLERLARHKTRLDKL